MHTLRRRRWIGALFAIICTVAAAQAAPQAPARPAEQALTLNAAVQYAVRHNPDIVVLRIDPQEARAATRGTQGAMDPLLGGTVAAGKNKLPSGSTITGSSYDERFFNGDLTVEQLLSTGTKLTAAWRNSRLASSALDQGINPQWTTRLGIGVTQPLLKGAGAGSPGMVVRIARTEERAAAWEYRASLADQVQGVIGAYWSQRLAEDQVRVAAQSVKLAEELNTEAEGALRAGRQTPLAVSEASAQVALRQTDLLAALNQLRTAGQQLRRALGQDMRSSSPDPLRLADLPELTVIDTDEAGSVQQALTLRPELRGLDLRRKAAELNERAASNGLLPELNLIAEGDVNGLAGRIQPGDTDPGINRFAGGYRDALEQLAHGDFYGYQGGIQLRYPLGNNTAKAQYDIARLELNRVKLSRASAEQTIVVEVRNALTDVTTARKQIDSAKASLGHAQEALRAGQERHRVGLTTTREVVELQRDLTEADSALSQAFINYTLAIAAVYHARGELLTRCKIEVLE